MYRARHRGDGRVAAVKLLHRSAWADPSFRVRFRRECDALAHLGTRTSCRSTTSARRAAAATWRCPSPAEEAWPGCLAAGSARRPSRVSRSSPPPRTRWTPPTRPASCTATSRPTTSCSIPTGPGWRTSGSPAPNRAATTTGDGLLIGTAGYLAPEVISGAPAGPAADRYALAAVAFRTLAGRPPFEADGVAGLLYAHVHRAPPRASSLRSGLPRSLDAALAAGSPRIPRRARGRPGPWWHRSSGPSRRAARGSRARWRGPAALAAGPRAPAILLAAGLLAAGGAAAGLTMTLGGGAPARRPPRRAPPPPCPFRGPDGAPVAARHALPADLPGLPVAARLRRRQGGRRAGELDPGRMDRARGRGAGAGGRGVRDRPLRRGRGAGGGGGAHRGWT